MEFDAGWPEWSNRVGHGERSSEQHDRGKGQGVTILNGARITLGVSGGIAAYKAADLASKLVQSGATVDVLLTQGATEFIQPLTFQAITKQPVHVGVFEGWT